MIGDKSLIDKAKFINFGSSGWPWARNTFTNVLALSCLNWLYCVQILLRVHWDVYHNGSRVERLSEQISVLDRSTSSVLCSIPGAQSFAICVSHTLCPISIVEHYMTVHDRNCHINDKKVKHRERNWLPSIVINVPMYTEQYVHSIRPVQAWKCDNVFERVPGSWTLP